jgi:hypothetical protein
MLPTALTGAASILAELVSASSSARAAGPDLPVDKWGQPGKGDFDYQLAYQRGIEAVLWSMPAISDVFFRESLFRDFGMKPGDIVVMSKPLVARHEVLTANNQVNYASMAFDVSAGPLVVEIPASSSDYAVIGEICDNWQEPVTGVGVIGPDAGKGGKYLLMPPGHKETVSDDYLKVPLEGFRGTMVFRPVVIGKGNMEGSIALARQTRTYPLSDAANPKPGNVLDGWHKPWHSLPVYDLSWFRYLAKFIDDEPIRPRDKAMVGMLSSLGIERGKPFKPDPVTTKALEAAINTAYEMMQYGFVTPGKAMTSWWPDRQWMNMNPAMMARMGEAWSFTTADAVYSYDRAIAPFFWANYLPPKMGSEQLYLMGMRDSTGALLSGKQNYVVRVPADVPVDKFWSIIVYSLKTKSFIPNTLGQVGLDSYEKSKLKANTDGSINIYLGSSAPKGEETNWLPSSGEDFFVIMRYYGPGKSVYDKTWSMPDIRRMI